jgi:lysophospholipase L1-like esterase
MATSLTAKITNPAMLDASESQLAPDQFRYRVLAEGDSWFSMADLPVTLVSTNQLNALRFKDRALVINCAEPGDEIKKDIVDWSASRTFRRLLKDGIGAGTDLILLSGGGNDLASAGPDLIKPFDTVGAGRQPQDYVDALKLELFLEQYVKASFRQIVQWRDAAGSASRGVPIVTHTYDIATPRNAPAAVGLGTQGPWLMPTFVAKGYPADLWEPLAAHLVQALGEAIVQLQDDEALPEFHVVRTQGTLAPAPVTQAGRTDDWLNEIHPTAHGYQQLAQKWQPVLDAVI